MKKTITLLTILIFSFVWSQEKVEKFQITPNGLNGYVVKQFEGKEASEIFVAIKKWGEYNINNTNQSIKSKIENEFLNYQLFYDKGITINCMGKKHWDVLLDVEMRIKKDKIRYDIKIISMKIDDGEETPDFTYSSTLNSWSFFKKNGKPRRHSLSAKNNIEGIANGIVSSVSQAILGKVDSVSDNW